MGRSRLDVEGRVDIPATQADAGGAALPVLRLDRQGRPAPFAHIQRLGSGHFRTTYAAGAQAGHEGLPWWLDDLRPQGFMGRAFAHTHPELQLPADPRQWTGDQVLRALAVCGDDLPGNLVLGGAALQPLARVDYYPQLAGQALQGACIGAPLGGQQPKFCSRRAGQPVLVKFSPAEDSAVAQRTRDLLVCEHLALQTLARAGVPAARTQILQAAGHVFLESERFDRCVQADGAIGRIAMASLRAFGAHHLGAMDDWAATAERLAARGLLRPPDADRLCLLEAYGLLIANSDRHDGNVSLLQDEGGAWVLAPAYDMLPMLYAPVAGELLPRDFSGWPLQPTAATLACWPQAVALAQAFWQAAADDTRISAGFRAVARANGQLLALVPR